MIRTLLARSVFAVSLSIVLAQHSHASSPPAQAVTPNVAKTAIKNDDVVKLANAGISDDIVVGMIHKSIVDCDCSPDGLIALKHNAVSDQVMRALVIADHTTAKVRVLTTDDFVKLVNARFDPDTIGMILTGATFDSSPDALIFLKEHDVPESIIAAMVTTQMSSNSKSTEMPHELEGPTENAVTSNDTAAGNEAIPRTPKLQDLSVLHWHGIKGGTVGKLTISPTVVTFIETGSNASDSFTAYCADILRVRLGNKSFPTEFVLELRSRKYKFWTILQGSDADEFKHLNGSVFSKANFVAIKLGPVTDAIIDRISAMCER